MFAESASRVKEYLDKMVTSDRPQFMKIGFEKYSSFYVIISDTGTESLESGGGSGSATPIRTSKESSPATDVAAAASKLKMPASKVPAASTQKRESLSQV